MKNDYQRKTDSIHANRYVQNHKRFLAKAKAKGDTDAAASIQKDINMVTTDDYTGPMINEAFVDPKKKDSPNNFGNPQSGYGVFGSTERQKQPMPTGWQPTNHLTNVPPAPGNQINNMNPNFNPMSQQMAAGVFGDPQMRQNAVGATPLYEITEEELKSREKELKKASRKNKIEKFSKELEPWEFSRTNPRSYFHDYEYADDYEKDRHRTIKQQREYDHANAPLENRNRDAKIKKKPRIEAPRYETLDGKAVHTMKEVHEAAHKSAKKKK